MGDSPGSSLDRLRERHPDKFAPRERIFANIRRGDRIFVGTACAEPQHLVAALAEHVLGNPVAAADAEILQFWTLGVTARAGLPANVRHNSFFIGNGIRDAVNSGLADYTPIFLSQLPDLIRGRLVPIDVALIQVSLPDDHGYFSLGISVDIVKAAVEHAALVIAQVNPRMPRVYGDGFVSAEEIDFLVVHDEPLLEFEAKVPDEIARRVGRYVARIVQDGDTIQVGYGSLPNAILSALGGKKHLGVHTELLTDGIADLIRLGVVDNSRKTLDRGRTVASFCMGRTATYDFVDDNPAVEFRGIDYTNDPLVISRHENMTAINSALEIDLTGQATRRVDRHDLLQRDRRAGGLHARRDPRARREDDPRAPVHGRARRGLQDRSVRAAGRGSDAQPRRHPVRRHRVRHRPPARQEHPGAGHGADRHRAPEVQAVAGRGRRRS